MIRYTESVTIKAVILAILLCASPGISEDSSDAKRERELRIPDIIHGLGLQEGSSVADIGAGDGFYEVALSRAVDGGGRVYAEDIDENNAVKHICERVAKDHLGNVTDSRRS